MTRLLELPEGFPPELSDPQPRALWCCTQLEEGNILFFASPPFETPSGETEFLLSQRQSGAGYHKNIAYRPAQDRLNGQAEREPAQVAKLRAALRGYSERATRFTSGLLAPYAESLRVDFTSFRPQREEGRQIRVRARNDLIHFDSFPTRPSNGDRILRVFTNINPSEPRLWITSGTFDELAGRFAGSTGLPVPTRFSLPHRAFCTLAHGLGLGSLARSPYDHWMLRFHHFLKEHEEFQGTSARTRLEFPPRSTWLVFTDMVSHAVVSGQYALEQTFIVSKDSLVTPEKAPLRILEHLAGCELTLN